MAGWNKNLPTLKSIDIRRLKFKARPERQKRIAQRQAGAMPWVECGVVDAVKHLAMSIKMTTNPYSLRYFSHKSPKSITFVGDRRTPATRASSMNPWLPLLANL